MQKRIFFWQHVTEFFLLARIYHISFIPLHLFFILTLALFKLKHQVQGINFITYGVAVFYLLEMIGELLDVKAIQYAGSICGGLLFFLPVRMYWLPESRQLPGFRHDEVDGRHYFEFYPIRDDDEAVRVKSLKWCSGIEKQIMLQNLNIKNSILYSLAHLGLSFVDKVRFFYGQGLTEQTKANIIFSHGKGATPLMYTNIMRHLTTMKYRIGGLQHTEQSYIWVDDRQGVKQFRSKQVILRSQQIHKVIDEQLYSDKMILMGHSYGCATVIQAYHTLRKQLKDKITHIILLDPWLFPLTEQVFEHKVDVPIMILANESFVDYRDIYNYNRQFAERNKVDYIIWKGTEHKQQTDFGYVFGNYMGIVKNSKDTDLHHTLNFQAIDNFLKGEKVEGTFGDRQLGRDYKPATFHKDDYYKW